MNSPSSAVQGDYRDATGRVYSGTDCVTMINIVIVHDPITSPVDILNAVHAAVVHEKFWHKIKKLKANIVGYVPRVINVRAQLTQHCTVRDAFDRISEYEATTRDIGQA